MDDRLYRFLSITALALGIAWVGWTVWDGLFAHRGPGDMAYLAGQRAFEDRQYAEAETEYRAALDANQGHVHAWRGLARTLIQLERHREALEAFDEALGRNPEAAGIYANRGILHDRMGRHEAALADYERALELDPSIAEGPGWLTRFLRLQPEAPPTIAGRARYLREELAKPPGERLLQVPELDAEQRPYKR
jgi:tetratricopeptide (TPR) repeat protein